MWGPTLIEAVVAIRPMEPVPAPWGLVNQRALPGPAVILLRGVKTLGSVKLETTPAVVIRPMDSKPLISDVNQSAPSGPAVMAPGPLVPQPASTFVCLQPEL